LAHSISRDYQLGRKRARANPAIRAAIMRASGDAIATLIVAAATKRASTVGREGETVNDDVGGCRSIGTQRRTKMSKPEPINQGAAFNLAAIDAEMRGEDAYQRDGHAARTLVREDDIRIILMVMRAGARIAEHRANDTASIHTLSGNVRLRLPDHDAELPAGRLLVLERGLRHAVEAVAESAFLLTLGRQAK
jgi:quercetin dioxygenase-like cupin family protein